MPKADLAIDHHQKRHEHRKQCQHCQEYEPREKLSKNDFIGTAAWVFFTINLIKVPFQFFIWKNINVETLKIDIFLIPALLLGFLFGIKLVGKINEMFFRKLIMTLTLIGSFLIFFI